MLSDKAETQQTSAHKSQLASQQASLCRSVIQHEQEYIGLGKFSSEVGISLM